MALTSRKLALVSGLAFAFGPVVASTSAATTHTLPLLPTKMASHARGTAVLAPTSSAEDRVTITARGLPVASTLPTKPTRHVYITWVLGAHSSRAHLVTLGAIPLHAARGGSYVGSGVVMMPRGARLLVTAEVSARVRRPAIPVEGVLISGM